MCSFCCLANSWDFVTKKASFFAEKQKIRWVGSRHYDVRHLSGAGKDRFTRLMQVLKVYIVGGKIQTKTKFMQIELNENTESRAIRY